MNAETIAQMEAGRELDALVAEKVMGWTMFSYQMLGSGGAGEFRWIPPGRRDHVSNIAPVPRYSTDIAAAWEVVEKVTENLGHWPFMLFEDRYGGTYSGGKWVATFGIDPSVVESGPMGEDTDAMWFWGFQLDDWEDDPDALLGGAFKTVRRDPEGAAAASSNPALAICRAALLAVLATPTPEAPDARD